MEFTTDDDVRFDGQLLETLYSFAYPFQRTQSAPPRTEFSIGEKLQLHFDPEQWLNQGDRCLYVRFPEGYWVTNDRQRSIIELLIRIGDARDPHPYILERLGYIGLVFNDTTVRFIASCCVQELEDTVASALFNVTGHSEEEVVPIVEVYIAPSNTAPERSKLLFFVVGIFVCVDSRVLIVYCVFMAMV